jgi:co-chaperonin GroES (HSP10)
MPEPETVLSAYVDADDRVLDPTLLEQSVLDRMPQPTGWRMLVLDKEALATVIAYVVKQGPLCYGDKNKYGTTKWCEENQWVLIGRYSGARFKLDDGAEVRIINDDEVIATILNPDDILSV